MFGHTLTGTMFFPDGDAMKNLQVSSGSLSFVREPAEVMTNLATLTNLTN